MKPKKLYIKTIGCQMNVYDSERIATALRPSHYRRSADAEDAALIIVNTCAIREKAEQKVFSFLGRLNRYKKKRPQLRIGVGGCVAQQQGRDILERMSFVDFVFGPQAISRLASIVERVENNQGPVVDVAAASGNRLFDWPPATPAMGQVTRYVTVMQGCDNYCAYCVVPHVRGREISRRPKDIVAEVEALVAAGVREVTLLGQNVNSYGIKEGYCSFSELLALIDTLDGLLRIRFTTSHPKDLSPSLCHAFRDLAKLCRHIHLPVQSGSNSVLRRMNRRYTRERYLEKTAELRNLCPDIAISSDIIVGFPGESPANFDQTLDLIRSVEFDSLFAFKYSDRPQTPAIGFEDKVCEQEKNLRLQRLLAQQKRITLAKHRSLLGSVQEVLVEGLHGKKLLSDDDHGPSAPATLQWTGRTVTNKIVNFEQDALCASESENLTGRLVAVKIEKAYAHSLWGVPISVDCLPAAVKGAKSYAA
jgi:tRNA-2-methylthio-N6-dimethylallyladenosine synthase